MPAEVRLMVVRASRQEGVTVSQWLEKIIREHLDAVSNPVNPVSPKPSGIGDPLDLLREARAMAAEP
jgi:hypothetical protein